MGFLLLPLYHSWEKAKGLWEASPIGVLNKVFTWSSPLVSPVNVGPVSCKAMADLVPVAEKKLLPAQLSPLSSSLLLVGSPKPWEQSQGKPLQLQQTSKMAKQERRQAGV